MSDYETPKFPPMATPEDVKAASEKVMNFWVGALSPMWVPFWAASSFGLSAWAMTQSLSKGERLLKDMPLAGKWPGFNGVWNGTAAVTEDAADTVTGAVVEAVEAAPEPAVAFDPVIEAPVAIEQAAVEAPTVLRQAAEAPVKVAARAAKAVAPKPVARAVSAVRKPKA